MADPKYLPVKASAQNLALAEAKPRESLVGRGLAAIRDGGMLAKQRENDALYRQARQVYERHWGGPSLEHYTFFYWRQSEHALELWEAFETFQRLAAEGYGKAYYPLSRFYGHLDESEESHERAVHFGDLAFQWCVANQAQNAPYIWNDLGELYLSKFLIYYPDTHEFGDENFAQLAFDWFQKAAVGGYALAQFNLGREYQEGIGAVEPDDAVAAAWFQKAAEQGNALAQEFMGTYGVENNAEIAAAWYQKAADQGLPSAQSFLGWMYESGQGVAQNDEKAVFWYQKAAKQGNTWAQNNLNSLLSRMAPAQPLPSRTSTAPKQPRKTKATKPKSASFQDGRQLSLFDDDEIV